MNETRGVSFAEAMKVWLKVAGLSFGGPEPPRVLRRLI